MADLPASAIDQAGDDADPEARLGRAVSIGLPVATFLGFMGVSLVENLATGILVLVAGGLLGTITLFWASLRLVTGDAAVAPELEALGGGVHAVDHLASRKTMLVRAIKDLDNEHALGKLDDEDHALIRGTYREELKDVLKEMDEALAPFRGKAEALATAHLAKKDAEPPPVAVPEAATSQDALTPYAVARRACAACAASNEPDARFCKGCGGPLETESADA